MERPELKKDLAEADLFRGLTEKDLVLFTKLGTIKRFKKGDHLVAEDQQGHDVFIILAGRADIEITLPDSGRAQVIATIKKGEILGDLMLLDYVRRSASARAKDDVTTITWTKEELLELFEKNTRIGYVVMRNLAKIIARRLTATNMELRNVMNKMIEFA